MNANHPIKPNEVFNLPCGCKSMRVPSGNYVCFAKPDCRFDGRKIGRVQCGHLFVPFGTAVADVPALMARNGLAA